MSEEISMRELIKRLGITSYNAIYKAVNAGRITRLANGKFLWPEVKDDWENNRDLSKVRDENILAKSSNSESAAMFVKARLKNEYLKGKKAEIEIDVMQNNLIDKTKACNTMFNFARITRDMFMNMPPRFAPEMAARLKVDEFALTQELDKSIRTVLNEVAECVLTFE